MLFRSLPAAVPPRMGGRPLGSQRRHSMYFLSTSCTPARCHRGHLPLARSRMHTATSHAIQRWNEPSATALSTIAACGRARNQPTDSGNQQSPASSHQPDTSPGDKDKRGYTATCYANGQTSTSCRQIIKDTPGRTPSGRCETLTLNPNKRTVYA